ncbi:HAD family hydrolase [Vibrio paucivorans]|uniref:HAD hydrolase-like protein n=1 Tax=Vibrio paucivorans TaxID=2829489 RepID=A0A9X3CD28_9VIBR|nr:HAD hydrolase-like protein [Vibrio paucivorans]MCW8333442.1 HAD hydrolase-like protein [Vibrio paucivorans]
MAKVYLFDWGNTLMVDFPLPGKMCDWPKVEAVDGADQMLSELSKTNQVFIATSAVESSEQDIQRAFERVGLSEYISGYFCKQNLGILKGSAEFYRAIVERLNVEANQVIMVGDTLEKDITPAIEAGISAIWFNPSSSDSSLPHYAGTYNLESKGAYQVHHLMELLPDLNEAKS